MLLLGGLDAIFVVLIVIVPVITTVRGRFCFHPFLRFCSIYVGRKIRLLSSGVLILLAAVSADGLLASIHGAQTALGAYNGDVIRSSLSANWYGRDMLMWKEDSAVYGKLGRLFMDTSGTKDGVGCEPGYGEWRNGRIVDYQGEASVKRMIWERLEER
jgi:hypothetical protein